MNKNILIVLGGAVAVAVLVAVLVQVSLGSQKKVQAEQVAKVEVLVATTNLAIGRELKPGDMRWQEWPQTSVFPGAIIREDKQVADEVLKGRLARNIAKGEPVMKNALLGTAKGNFVAASLEPGQRAIAIEVSASTMVGGFIGPGDFVDVILTYKQSIRPQDDNAAANRVLEMNIDKMATETILQNIKVLAVDQMATRPDDEKIKVGKTVTVAVNAQEAERIFLASEMGELTLSLRGVGDEKIVEKNWPTISDARLTNVEDEIFREYEKVKKDTGANANIVRIYQGGSIQVVPTF
jgi:pilus assembly protein CpaB